MPIKATRKQIDSGDTSGDWLDSVFGDSEDAPMPGSETMEEQFTREAEENLKGKRLVQEGEWDLSRAMSIAWGKNLLTRGFSDLGTEEEVRERTHKIKYKDENPLVGLLTKEAGPARGAKPKPKSSFPRPGSSFMDSLFDEDDLPETPADKKLPVLNELHAKLRRAKATRGPESREYKEIMKAIADREALQKPGEGTAMQMFVDPIDWVAGLGFAGMLSKATRGIPTVGNLAFPGDSALKAFAKEVGYTGRFAADWATMGLYTVGSYAGRLLYRAGIGGTKYATSAIKDPKLALDQAKGITGRVLSETFGSEILKNVTSKFFPQLAKRLPKRKIDPTDEAIDAVLGKGASRLLTFKPKEGLDVAGSGMLIGAGWEAYDQLYEQEFTPEKIALWAGIGGIASPLAKMGLMATQRAINIARETGKLPSYLLPFFAFRGGSNKLQQLIREAGFDVNQISENSLEFKNMIEALPKAFQNRTAQVFNGSISRATNVPGKTITKKVSSRIFPEDINLKDDYIKETFYNSFKKHWEYKNPTKSVPKAVEIRIRERIAGKIEAGKAIERHAKGRKPGSFPRTTPGEKSADEALIARWGENHIKNYNEVLRMGSQMLDELETAFLKHKWISPHQVAEFQKKWIRYFPRLYQYLEDPRMFSQLAGEEAALGAGMLRYKQEKAALAQARGAGRGFLSRKQGRLPIEQSRGVGPEKIIIPKNKAESYTLPDRGGEVTVSIQPLTDAQVRSGKLRSMVLEPILGGSRPRGALVAEELARIEKNADWVLPKGFKVGHKTQVDGVTVKITKKPKGFVKLPKDKKYGNMSDRYVKTEIKDRIDHLIERSRDAGARLKDPFHVIPSPSGSNPREFWVFRDHPDWSRRMLGEYKSPEVPLLKSYGDGMRKSAYREHLKKVFANDEWVVDAKQIDAGGGKGGVGYTQATQLLRDTVLKQAENVDLAIPQVFKFTHGKFIRNDVYTTLQHTWDIAENTPRLINKVIGMWKYGKILLNPAAMARNVMSNVFLADFGGLSPHTMLGLKTYVRGMQEIAGTAHLPEHFSFGVKSLFRAVKQKVPSQLAPKVKVGKFMEEAMSREAAGVLGETMSKIEMQQLRHYGKSLLDEGDLTGWSGLATRMLTGISKAGDKFGKTIKLSPSETYHAAEAYSKLSLFIHARHNIGLSVKDSANHVRKYLIDYKHVSPIVDKLRKGPLAVAGAPFITFTSKAIPVYLEQLIKNPLKALKWPVAMLGITEGSRFYQGLTPESVKSEREINMLNPLRWVLLPFTDSKGKSTYMDMGFILPFGEAINAIDVAKGNAPWTSVGSIPFFNSPLVSMVLDLVNVSKFAHPHTSKAADPSGTIGFPKDYEDALVRARNLLRTILPPTTPKIGYSALSIEKALRGHVNPSTGENYDLQKALWSTLVGIKLKNPDSQSFFNRRMHSLIERQKLIKRRFRVVEKDQTLTDVQREKKLARYHEDMEDIDMEVRRLDSALRNIH